MRLGKDRYVRKRCFSIVRLSSPSTGNSRKLGGRLDLLGTCGRLPERLHGMPQNANGHTALYSSNQWLRSSVLFGPLEIGCFCGLVGFQQICWISPDWLELTGLVGYHTCPVSLVAPPRHLSLLPRRMFQSFQSFQWLPPCILGHLRAPRCSFQTVPKL